MPKNSTASAPANPRPASGSNPSTPRTPSSGKGASAIYRSISACNRCRSRKTKCDQLFPACSSCAKAGVECVGVDAATGREIPRSYVSHLEERIATLEAQLAQVQTLPPPSLPPPLAPQHQHQLNGGDENAPILRGSLGTGEETGRKRKPSHDDGLPMRPDLYDPYRDNPHGSVTLPPPQPGVVNAGAPGAYERRPVTRDDGNSRSGAHLKPDIENLVTAMTAVTEQGTNHTSFQGNSSGISFAKLMFAAVKVSSKENSHLPAKMAAFRGRIPAALANKQSEDSAGAPQSEHDGTPPVMGALQRIKPRPAPAPLPERKHAEELIDIYFQQANPQIPILHRPGFTERFNSVYQALEANPDLKESQLPEQEMPTLYFLNMVFAIAAGMRSDTKSMPEQYHSAAVQYMDSLFSTTNRLDGLKGVLLLALYSLMRPASPGVWYVLGSAMRMCIDLGLHQETPQMAQRLDALTLDERRRLWWSVYSLDRQICVYLGRPFGIADEVVKVPYPEDIDDKFISKAGIMKDHPLAHQKSSRTIARHMFRIRQLQSEIQCILYQQSEIPRKFNTLEDWRKDMEARLNEWTVSVPKNQDDANCGYNMGFIDLNYQQTRLLLYGLSPAVPEPTTEAYLVIADSGNRIIKAYRQLYRDKKINYTWVACHNLFLASTSYLCALWHCEEIRRRTSMDEIDFNTRACVTVLDSMQDLCPAAVGCRDVFLNLATATVQLCNDYHQKHKDENSRYFGKRAKTDRGDWSKQRRGSRSNKDYSSGSPRMQLEPIKHALPASLANIVHSAAPSPISPATTQTLPMAQPPEHASVLHYPTNHNHSPHSQQQEQQQHGMPFQSPPLPPPSPNHGGTPTHQHESIPIHGHPHRNLKLHFNQMQQDHQQQQQQQEAFSMSPPSQSPLSHHSSHLSPSSGGVQSPLAGLQQGHMMMQDYSNSNNLDQVMRTAEQLNWEEQDGRRDEGQMVDDGMGGKVFHLISGVGGGDIWNQYDFTNGDASHSNEYALGDAANINMGMGNMGFINHMGSGTPVPDGYQGAGYVNPFPGGF